MNSNLIHQNKLLTERNSLLKIQNQRLIDELQTLKLESMLSLQRAKTQQSQYNSETMRYTQNQHYQSDKGLTIFEIQRQQLNILIKQKMVVIERKNLRLQDSEIKDRIKMLTEMNNQSIFTGFFRVLFEALQQCLNAQIKRANICRVEKQNNMDKKFGSKFKQQRQTLLFVKDPNYVVQQLSWISKFRDQFQIIKGFYQKLIQTIVSKYSISRTTQLSLILNKFCELQDCKLQLYKLAVKADNQQRDYELKVKSGRPMQLLQVSINNTLQKIKFHQQCMKEHKQAIDKYLKRM